MPCPGPAAPRTLEAFLEASLPPTLLYPSFAPTIIQRPNFDANIHAHPEIFNRIVCPYDPDAFALFLDKHDLTSLYPNLVNNLRNGFPLGPMPNLLATNILPNHPTVLDYLPDVDEYLKDEVAAGRMSGPFSKEMVEGILRGPFQSSPLIVSVQPQGPGEPDKIRICRHLSKSSRNVPSVNSFISKHNFPTRFDTASRVADMVSSFLYTFGMPFEHVLHPVKVLSSLFRPTKVLSSSLPSAKLLSLSVHPIKVLSLWMLLRTSQGSFLGSSAIHEPLPSHDAYHSSLAGCSGTSRHSGLHTGHSQIPPNMCRLARPQGMACVARPHQ